jgi:hypothetical protein
MTGGLPKEGRSAALFCRHLDDLRRAFRHYRVIHVVCDNARTRKPEHSRLLKEFPAEWGGRGLRGSSAIPGKRATRIKQSIDLELYRKCELMISISLFCRNQHPAGHYELHCCAP